MNMKTLITALVLLVTIPAHAADVLPDGMVGYWRPTDHYDKYDAWHMTRIPKWEYEWTVKNNSWEEWDGACKIHDVKELGANDYEVWATCGVYPEAVNLTDDVDPGKIDGEPWEDHYQFSLCGETLTVKDLKEGQPVKEEGCKIS
jgi:hypothetical protein